MIFLIHHIRKLVFVFSAILAGTIYLFLENQIPSSSLLTIRLTETYAFTAVIYLYFALLASPLFSAFPNFPYKTLYLRARKAIGVSAFFFVLLHVSFALFGLFGGFHLTSPSQLNFHLFTPQNTTTLDLSPQLPSIFVAFLNLYFLPISLFFPGLSFLSTRYQEALFFSSIAFFILSIMALTSLNFFVVKLGHFWKKLHRLVYVAALFIIIHALLIGTHFIDLGSLIPQLSLLALGVLLFLEGLRLDKFLTAKFSFPNFGISLLATVGVFGFLLSYIVFPSGSTPSLNAHSAHQQLAAQAQQQNSFPNRNNNPSLIGDKTKRYTVSFNDPSIPSAGEDVNLSFKVYDASNGKPVTFFSIPYEKPLHLIIVNNELTYFNHLHPTQTENQFQITTQFPKDDNYRLYLDFQPVGAIEQQVAFSLKVGTPTAQTINQTSDTTKVFGDTQVSLKVDGTPSAAKMSLGSQKITFTLKDTKTKEPVTDLKPYLATYGHLVMINESTFDYLHVHPFNLTRPNPNAKFGPSVDFMPIGIYGVFKPGTYRAFAQFNRNGNIFVADFTIKLE